MRNLLLIAALLFMTVPVFSQGNSNGKGNGKHKNKTSKNSTKAKNHKDGGVWDGVENNASYGKSSKNQPKKVQAALLRDYPGARNIAWSKYKGDYTATFTNGVFR